MHHVRRRPQTTCRNNKNTSEKQLCICGSMNLDCNVPFSYSQYFVGASRALRASLSFAVHVCLRVERKKNLKTPPSPSPLYEHLEKCAPPFGMYSCGLSGKTRLTRNEKYVCERMSHLVFVWSP